MKKEKEKENEVEEDDNEVIMWVMPANREEYCYPVFRKKPKGKKKTKKRAKNEQHGDKD
jgi:hypothetical protein